eukprot:3840885-Pleurochrysis_carterae.AAC.1
MRALGYRSLQSQQENGDFDRTNGRRCSAPGEVVAVHCIEASSAHVGADNRTRCLTGTCRGAWSCSASLRAVLRKNSASAATAPVSL